MARLTKRTPSGWALAAPCAPGVPLAMLARYENIGSAHQFRHLSELNTPKSPYPDSDTSILECPCCGSGEWLHNADESQANFCGQCGQAIDWTEPEVHCGDCEHLTFSDCYGECGKGYKGIVQPGDSCGKGVAKKHDNTASS